MPVAHFWNYRYSSFQSNPDWLIPIGWIAGALLELGWNLLQHPNCQFDIAAKRSGDRSKSDLVIYNHATAKFRKRIGAEWYFKSTGPGRLHTTLDPIGYGPYSQLTYRTPDWRSILSVADFELYNYFETKVNEWISGKTSKWGAGIFDGPGPSEEEYVLVVGQTLGDATVSEMWFGNYRDSLTAMVKALVHFSRVPVVVKLHPWTDGSAGYSSDGRPLPQPERGLTEKITQSLQALGASVYSGMSSIHDFLPRARAVVLCNSTAGIDALLHHKPVITWGYPEYHWASYDLRHLCDLPIALALDWYDRNKADKFIYWYTEKYCIYDEASALRRVTRLIGEGF